MVRKSMFAAATLAAMLASTPVLADVKAGVDAWGRGDYPAAIKAWRADAIAGDADAQFNLGQAYKLGRGVPVDLKLAEEWYRKAAAQGHLQAEDNYGLMLFQNGDRQRALPIIEKSAGRGEPRAQYVYGTALFNGDLITKDWPRAYALMTRASAAGLAPASTSLAQMDKFIPLDQRQRGLAIARDLEARAARPQTTMSDVGGMPSIPRGPAISPRPETAPMPRAIESAPVPAPVFAPEAPRPERVQTAQAPSWNSGAPSALPRPGERRRGRPVAEPQVAPEAAPLPQPPEAQSYPYPAAPAYPEPSYPQESYPPQAEMPPMQDGAGASYPEPGYPAPSAAPAPRSYPAPAPRPRPAPAPVVRKAPPAAVSGGYRVQLGAFSEAGRARALWSSLSGQVAGLKGLQPYLVKAGPITRLQAGPLGSKAAAERLCGQVRSAAQSCLVVSQ